jgi:hypothetical protein
MFRTNGDYFAEMCVCLTETLSNMNVVAGSLYV